MCQAIKIEKIQGGNMGVFQAMKMGKLQGEKTGKIFYLTGANGFIGGQIVKFLSQDSSVLQVYCPMRDRKQKTAKERFQENFHTFSKCAFLNLDEPVPSNVTHVILNAYDTRFFGELEQKLRQNVIPILRILDECRQLGPQIKGITIVSTAYVQQPLPLVAPPYGRIPFLFEKFTTASEMYDKLVLHGTLTGQEINSTYDKKTLPSYYKKNVYVLSKHIMEHVLKERYADLPICIVRPSMVTPSRDGTYGYGDQMAGVPLFIAVLNKGIIRAPRTDGKLNFVFVEDAAQDIIDGAMKYATPAYENDGWHPIRMATTASDFSCKEPMEVVTPNTFRYYGSWNTPRMCIRFTEKLLLRITRGKRASKLLKSTYKAYDFYFTNTWDYPATHPSVLDTLIENTMAYYEREQAMLEKKKQLKHYEREQAKKKKRLKC